MATLLLSGCSQGPDWARIGKRDHIVQWTRVRSIYDSLEDRPVLKLDGELTLTVSVDDAIANLEAKGKINTFFYGIAAKLRSKCTAPHAYSIKEFTDISQDLLVFVVRDLLTEGKFVLKRTSTHEIVREIVIGKSRRKLDRWDYSSCTIGYLPDGKSFFYTLDQIS
jgi:hypothetical protein